MRETATITIRKIIVLIALCICGIYQPEAAADEMKITGSTTFAPLVKAVADSFMTKNPDIKIVFTQTNADASINAIINQEVAIAFSARPINGMESEKAVNTHVVLNCNCIAIDAIIPIIHPSNNVRSLGLLQLNDIYTGRINSWNELTVGLDRKIKVITRESGSAMYEFWKDKVMSGEAVTPEAMTIQSSQEIVKVVAEDASAIGYTNFSNLSSRVKPLPLSGIDTISIPTEFHPLSRKLLMCTNGGLLAPVQKFVDFMTGSEGKGIMQKAGYVPY